MSIKYRIECHINQLYDDINEQVDNRVDVDLYDYILSCLGVDLANRYWTAFVAQLAEDHN